MKTIKLKNKQNKKIKNKQNKKIKLKQKHIMHINRQYELLLFLFINFILLTIFYY